MQGDVNYICQAYKNVHQTVIIKYYILKADAGNAKLMTQPIVNPATAKMIVRFRCLSHPLSL